MSFVLDSSLALAWFFGDQRTPEHLSLLERLTETGATAPSLWPLEVLNGLALAERRGRLDRAKRHRFARLLRELPVTLDSETAGQAWTETAALAERFDLTLYDASYLELARRTGQPLATLDEALRTAARELGVPLLRSV